MSKTRSSKANSVLFLLLAAVLAAGCSSRARVGDLQSESQTIEMQDGGPVRVEIDFGAGELKVSGGAEELLEADFTYNVSELKPEVEYEAGKLSVRQPDTDGLPVLRDITGFRNEWDLRLNDSPPMDMRVNIGAGTCDLQLASLSLSGLEVSLGAGESTIDLSGERVDDLEVRINAGAGKLSIKLPSEVGVRVEVEAGLGTIEAPGLKKDGDVYTNAAYGVSGVTLTVNIEAGIGQINLEME